MVSNKGLSLLLLLFAVLLVTGGQLCLKQAVTRNPFERAPDLLPLLLDPWSLVGIASYGFGTVLWLYGLSHLPLYVVTFFMVLPFALLLVAGLVLYGERPAAEQWGGIAAVGAGLILILWRA